MRVSSPIRQPYRFVKGATTTPRPNATSSISRWGASFAGPVATSPAAVDRDREVEEDVVRALRQLRFELLQNLCRPRGGGEQPRLDLVQRRELYQLLLERAREAATAEVPPVELLQKAGRAALAELSHGRAHEQDQLGDHVLARRLADVPVDDLPQRPRVPLGSPAHHHRGRAGRRQDRLRTSTRGH